MTGAAGRYVRAAAAAVIRSLARRPMVIAGGGVRHLGAEQALRPVCEATGIR